MYKRHAYQRLKAILEEPRRFIQVLFGPRQVGKTTLITQILKKLEIDNHFASADALAAAGSTWIEQQWEIARLQQKEKRKSGFLLVIDEVQKISNWSEIVKKLWDEDTRNGVPIKVVLLGSSRLLLQQGLTESLAGRFETNYLTHWSYLEMQQAFDWTVDQYIWFGGYPGSAELIDDETRWKNYVKNSLIETSISKDILMLTRIDKPALLKHLFETGCMYSGQIVSFNKMLGQLHDAGNTTTLSYYLQLLNTAGLLGGIEKFSGNVLRQRASIPKYQVHNVALISAQKSETFKEARKDPILWGRLSESAAGAHLINNAISNDYQLLYWRDQNYEVDFVLKKGQKVVGIEIKSGAKQVKSGMIEFKNQYAPDKMYLIGNDGLPIEEFLKINPVELF
jgi:predicted AAA+ superfamily ATPase